MPAKFSEHDLYWNQVAALAKQGVPHGGVCPQCLEEYQHCGCKDYPDMKEHQRCIGCGLLLPQDWFIIKTGKRKGDPSYKCSKCRSILVKKNLDSRGRMPERKYLET